MEIRTTQYYIGPKNTPIFSEHGFSVLMEDEAAGEFVVVKDHSCEEHLNIAQVRINPEEWPTLRMAIDMMIQECK